MALRTLTADPMLRMLVVAIALAAFLPAAGEGRAIAGRIADAGIFVLFLLNGMRVARRDVLAGVANWRFLLPLVLFVFGAMALAALGLAKIGGSVLPPAIALGFIFLGALPSTVQSATSYSSLAGGNVALSVVSAALLTILGVFISAPVFLLLGGVGEGEIGTQAVVRILAILILPFALGQLVRKRTSDFVARHRPSILWLDRSIIAIAVYVAVSGAVEQGIGGRVDAAAWAVLAALVLAMLLFAHLGAWLAGGALGLARADRIAFLFAGAQKSAAVGVPLATVLFPPSLAGFVVVPLLLYHLLQLVIAAPLANRLADPPRH